MADLAPRFFRVDPRLIHATLMNSWVPATGAECVLVADAQVAGDPRRRTILEMSAMDLVDVSFVPEDSVHEALQDCATHKPVIVLFAALESVETAVAAGLELLELNIGHLPEADGRRPVNASVCLGPSDMAAIERLEERGVRVRIQPLPNDEQVHVREHNVTADLLAELALTSSGAASGSETPVLGSGVERAEEELEIVNERGLHLRAAHVLAYLAGSLEADVLVGRPGSMVNAKSLLGLTTLGATRGTKLTVVVTGPNADVAMAAIRELFASGFDEGRFDRETGEDA